MPELDSRSHSRALSEIQDSRSIAIAEVGVQSRDRRHAASVADRLRKRQDHTLSDRSLACALPDALRKHSHSHSSGVRSTQRATGDHHAPRQIERSAARYQLHRRSRSRRRSSYAALQPAPETKDAAPAAFKAGGGSADLRAPASRTDVGGNGVLGQEHATPPVVAGRGWSVACSSPPARSHVCFGVRRACKRVGLVRRHRTALQRQSVREAVDGRAK